MLACFSEAASNTGAKPRQGPHHGAQKSTMTTSLPLMVDSKLSLVSSMTAMLVPAEWKGAAEGTNKKARGRTFAPECHPITDGGPPTTEATYRVVQAWLPHYPGPVEADWPKCLLGECRMRKSASLRDRLGGTRHVLVVFQVAAHFSPVD